MQKTVIAPIIGLIVVGVESIFHVQISDAIKNEVVDVVVNVAAVGAAFYGIFKNHKKEVQQ